MKKLKILDTHYNPTASLRTNQKLYQLSERILKGWVELQPEGNTIKDCGLKLAMRGRHPRVWVRYGTTIGPVLIA